MKKAKPAPRRIRKNKITIRNARSVTVHRKADGTVDLKVVRKKSRKRR